MGFIKEGVFIIEKILFLKGEIIRENVIRLIL